MATQTARGRIIAVQESRFRLATADGRGFLFTLARDAQVGAEELCRWQESRTLVRAEYTGEPGLDSCVAQAVYPLERGAAGASDGR